MNPKFFTAPSKTFLIGEYAVLLEGQALMLNTPPNFGLMEEQSLSTTKISNPFTPESPAGKLYTTHADQLANQRWFFYDPHAGQGGFGASSAQFVVLAQALGLSDPWQIWQSYQEISVHSQRMLKPSGADVLAQTQATGCVVDVDIPARKIQCHAWPFTQFIPVLIRTGIKLPTHVHLTEFSLAQCEVLLEPMTRARQAFRSQDPELFMDAFRYYAATLAKAGFVATHTEALLEQLCQHPAVLAAKGCGAMGADVICALINASQFSLFQQWAATHPWGKLQVFAPTPEDDFL